MLGTLLSLPCLSVRCGALRATCPAPVCATPPEPCGLTDVRYLCPSSLVPANLLSFSLSAVCDSLPLYLCLSFSWSSRTYVSISLSLSPLSFFFRRSTFPSLSLFLSLIPRNLSLSVSLSSPPPSPVLFVAVGCSPFLSSSPLFSVSAPSFSVRRAPSHSRSRVFFYHISRENYEPRVDRREASLSLPIPSAHSRPCENAREKEGEKERVLSWFTARPQIRRIFPFSSSCHAGSR